MAEFGSSAVQGALRKSELLQQHDKSVRGGFRQFELRDEFVQRRRLFGFGDDFEQKQSALGNELFCWFYPASADERAQCSAVDSLPCRRSMFLVLRRTNEVWLL